jgi:hypothetical protein
MLRYTTDYCYCCCCCCYCCCCRHRYVLMILGVSCLYEVALTVLDYQMKTMGVARFRAAALAAEISSAGVCFSHSINYYHSTLLLQQHAVSVTRHTSTGCLCITVHLCESRPSLLLHVASSVFWPCPQHHTRILCNVTHLMVAATMV